MQTLMVELEERSYPIHIVNGLTNHVTLILPYLQQKKAAIITNTAIEPLYANVLKEHLEQHGISVVTVVLPDGEAFKNSASLDRIYDALLQNRCERKTAIIGLGGGVIGDLAGFAAATYLRGVPFIQVPTTLLAQVDSSVGGKTGINHPCGKNLVGAFYQPRLVLVAAETLITLPEREFAAGLAEVIKYGLIRDAAFFEWLEHNIEKVLARDMNALRFVIYRSCQNKAQIVAADEREAGQRILLNLGHTFGHAIEVGMGYGKILHGEAVAAGIVLAAELSLHMGWLTQNEVDRIRQLLLKAGISCFAPDLGVERYLALMELDKKLEDGKIRFVLLKRIGEASVVSDVSVRSLRVTLSGVGNSLFCLPNAAKTRQEKPVSIAGLRFLPELLPEPSIKNERIA